MTADVIPFMRFRLGDRVRVSLEIDNGCGKQRVSSAGDQDGSHGTHCCAELAKSLFGARGWSPHRQRHVGAACLEYRKDGNNELGRALEHQCHELPGADV